MPGNVANAAPETVLPAGLCRAFRLSRRWAVDINRYEDGEQQSRLLVTTPRRAWELDYALTAEEVDEFVTFLDARRWIEPFYFYDGWETSPRFFHDPTGATSLGRFTVVARGDGWAWSRSLSRLAAMPIRLEEVT